MRRSFLILITTLLPVTGCGGDDPQPAGGAQASGGQGQRPGGAAAFERPPLTVDVTTVQRGDLSEFLMVVGNLTGSATVEVVPKVNGRLESVSVRMGDPVTRGRQIAKVEDREVREQVKQAQAAHEVAQATIRQRQADLRFAETNLTRSRNLFDRQLLPRQTLDDAEARQQAAVAQLDLAQAQFSQARARLDELLIMLNNTIIVSPVDGFVGARYLDAGAYASTQAPVASVVDVRLVRLVANLVEKDIKRVRAGTQTAVEVDAYPGEVFNGKVARIAPVLDPATRTAQIEIEVPNPGYRLKPGMYARVRMTVDRKENTLVVPRNAIVDIDGKRGVFVASGDTARFHPVATGIQDDARMEIVQGVAEGDRIVTTGAGALRDGDKIQIATLRRESAAPNGQPQAGGAR